MKIGAMVPQGWRMDLNGIKPEKQWDTILESSKKIGEFALKISILKYPILFSDFELYDV